MRASSEILCFTQKTFWENLLLLIILVTEYMYLKESLLWRLLGSCGALLTSTGLFSVSSSQMDALLKLEEKDLKHRKLYFSLT